MEYLTESGYRLEIGRVPRREIDTFVATHPMPNPPTRTVEVWGGIVEEVPDYSSTQYKRELAGYYISIGYEQIDLIAPAVSIDKTVRADEIADIHSLGIAGNDTELLQHILSQSPRDSQTVVEAVMYNSTVTTWGIMEAAELFGVTFRGKRVNPLIGTSDIRANGVFCDRLAVRWDGSYNWSEFCELPGPEQSEIVALYMISIVLERARGR